MENWKVQILDRVGQTNKDVTFYRDLGNGRYETVIAVEKGGYMVVEAHNMGAEIKPSIIMDVFMLQALADALNEIGIKPQKGYLEGKLEGTEKHLEDMRSLVFDNRVEISGEAKE